MTIAVVRAIVPDRAQYDRSTATGDGLTVEFQTPNRPHITGTAKVYVSGTLKATPADYAIDESLGLLTFTVAPALAAEIVVTYQHSLLSDADITAFLAAEGSIDKRAAALALETIASDNAMVLKVIKLLDLQTDGAKTSDALLKRAGLLREQAADENYTGGIDWAEMVVDDFSLRARLEAEALRG